MYKNTFLILLLVTAQTAFADNATITGVRTSQTDGLWTFDVTITHEDTGWGHFSDAWRILDKEGKEIGLRTLIHPHVDEQPLTRSLSGIQLPPGTTEVGIQTRDTMNGWASQITDVEIK